MSARRVVMALIFLLVLYMVVTLGFALAQGSMRWDWWWAVPVGIVFITIVLTFRILMQKSLEAAERADREAEAAEEAARRAQE